MMMSGAAKPAGAARGAQLSPSAFSVLLTLIDIVTAESKQQSPAIATFWFNAAMRGGKPALNARSVLSKKITLE